MGQQKDPVGRKLVKLAMEFHRARPWQSVEGDAPVLVRDRNGEEALVCVTGQSGLEPGLSAMFGEEAIHDFDRLLVGRGGWVPEISEYHVLDFEPWGELEGAKQRELQEWGLRPSKEGAAPVFLVLAPNGREDARLRRPNRGQLRKMVDVLQVLVKAHEEGVLQPQRLGEKRRVLELSIEGHGKSSRVLERFVVMPERRAAADRPPTRSIVSGERGSGGSSSTFGLARWKEVENGLTELMLERLGTGKWLSGPGPTRYFGSSEVADRHLSQGQAWGGWPMLLEWACLDYRARKRSKTVAEDVLRRGHLTPEQRALLTVRNNGIVSIFRVDRTEPGASVLVENLLDGTQHTIMDRSMSTSAKEGQFLGLRVYTIDGWTLAGTVTPVLPSHQVGPVLDLVRPGEQDRAGREGSIDTGRERFGRVWDLLEKAPLPVLQNTDGDALVLLRARFRAQEASVLAEQLQDHPEIEIEGEAELRWVWLRPSDKEGEVDPPVVVARLEQIGDELIVEVNSRERLQRVREGLSSVPGLTFEAVHEIEETADDRQPSPPVRNDPAMVASMQEQIRSLLIAQLDQPVPVFDDQTPRDAYRDPAWRQRVEEWVRTMPDASSPWGKVPPPREELLEILREGRVGG